MKNNPVILFDGVCNLCNGFVQFVIAHDTAGVFQFASLQSDAAIEILKKHGLPTHQLSSVVLSEGDRYYTKSDAALRVAGRLSGIWSLARVFLVLPKSLRDWGYDLVARNRYRLFGKKESCWLPTPELKQRFL